MALERTYVVPLRKGWLKAPKYKRAKKAVNTLRAFLVQHMKSEDVRIMPELSEAIWVHGIKCPPSKVKINVIKDDKSVVRAQLVGKEFPKEESKETAKKEKPKEQKEVKKEAQKEPAAKPVVETTVQKEEKPKKTVKKPAQEKVDAK